MVRHEGEKMSKSLGNLVMVRDLLKDWSADALRLYLAQHHYRSAWSHDPAELEGAERLAQHLREAVTSAGGTGPALDVSAVQVSFSEAMDDDLDTPAAIEQLEQLAGEIMEAAQAGQNVQTAQATLRTLSQVFGLRLDAPAAEEQVIAGWSEHLKRFTF
jgi:L-cysteine:1D-myo-inositol 2-amino-2-deoxy-alpha-D-glucopyranoside ligase